MKRITLQDRFLGSTDIIYTRFRRNKKTDHKVWTCIHVKNPDFTYKVGDRVYIHSRPWGYKTTARGDFGLTFITSEPKVGTIIKIKYEQLSVNGQILAILLFYVASKGVTIISSANGITPF